DVIRTGASTFHLLKDNRSYQPTLASIDFEDKTADILINGRNYHIHLKDKFDQLVSKLGLEILGSVKIRDVKAPMPGLVLNVAVDPGQTIQKGDKLLILEAMKMENVIKSDGEGIIKTIHVKQGAAVDKGQLLIEME
ncbi:MAG: acetyl-CoA carboxylase biotin carboxyl carrier protein subunit, partial [Flavobacteriaceae bacterium]|nr:acetyl-CoA carboxylase biotin carboxyl carrier protein subunit [Flavobacteriaceae bacterium]